MDSSEIPCAESECLHCCQSKQHGTALTSALSLRGISGSATIAFIHWLCSNCGQVVDTLGRTALHVAASCGCCDVARWLVRHCGAEVNLKDTESGYTPLHRSLFYGQIRAAISLIQLGANISSLDYDDLTALDHPMKDRMPYVEFNLSNPCEVYAWGSNSNYTLGIGNPRNVPEIVDFFRKQNTSVKQVSMNKFHSVFVTHDGRAFSCGHGQGGRLGLQSEKASLLPCQMKLTSPTPGTAVHVVAASLGRDHTVLLSESGVVWTCGLNTYHQLGHSPPPTSVLAPRALIAKIFRPVGDIQGVCTGRFHSVVWGPSGIMTFGLHAGQLGHGKGPEMLQTVPRLVSAVCHKEAHIIHVAASDGATVVVTKKGDVYSLHEYQCRKIATRLLDVVKVVVVGGHLDSRVDTNRTLIERGGDQLRIAVLTKSGKLFLWQESSQQMLRCIFSMRRPLLVTDFALCRTNFILFATRDGEAFEGEIRVRKPKKTAPGGVTSPGSGAKFHEFLEKSDCEQIKVKRLLHIHRAVSVTCDPKGRNYTIVQTHPQAALLAVPVVETSEMSHQMKTLLADSSTQDSIHDIMFLVGSREFPAHRFVVASRSEPLAKLIESKFVDSEEPMRVKVNNVKSDIFELILQYIYSGDCDMLKSGVCNVKGFDADFKENEEFLDLSNVSAYEVYSAGNNSKKIKNKQKKKVVEQQQQKKQNKDPVKILQDAARRFGLMSLHNELSHVKYENGVFKIQGQINSFKVKFDREKHPELCDVTVTSEDGIEFKAHRCILTSRLEYINSMLNHGWLESSQKSKLHLPIPHKVLQILIDFLYEDESPLVQESEDLDLVFSVLVVADQFFVTRLKEICEVTLSSLITLRNAAKILQVADTYNANQLKQCCMQYICLNLSAILEMRGLEFVDDSVLEELTKYYQDFNPIMSKRVITPYSDAPSQSLIAAVAEAYPVKFVDNGNSEEWEANESFSKKITKAVRKKVRIRKICGNDSNKMSERMRNESLSSNHSVISDEDEKHPLNSSDSFGRPNIDDVTLNLRKLAVANEDSSSQENSQWVKITTGQKKQSIKHILAAIKANEALKENPSVSDHVDNSITLTIRTQQHQSASVMSTKDSPQSVTPSNNSACLHSPPPDLISEFPELNLGSSSSTSQRSHQPKTSHKSPQVKNYMKISQKNRKKMAAELIEGGLEKGNTETPRISWGLSSEPPCSSLSDIMREETKQSRCASTPVPIRSNANENSSSAQCSPAANAWLKIPTSLLGSPEPIIQFSNIVADEKKQRINLSKMRAKPLELTQLEDQAIEDLLSFYNASTVCDERITVHRVITDSVATPTWITSHH